MKKYNFLLVMLAVSVFAISSCKDEEKCSTEWASETADEATAYTSAFTEFQSNPSTTTCNNYKTAINNYVDVLKSFEDCADLAGATRDQWEAAVASWESQRANVDTINCARFGTGGCNWQTGSLAEAAQMGAAASAYAQNQNSTTCNSYKVALQAYVNKLETYDSCVTGQDRTDWETTITNIEASITALGNC